AGEACLEELDKAVGRRPDLRHGFEAPRYVGYEIDLVDESASVPVLVEAVTQSIARLAHELKVRNAQIRELELVLGHARRAPTVQRFEWLESTADRERILDLLRDRLERIELPAPVTEIRLSAGPLRPAILDAGRLFNGAGNAAEGEAAVRLVERLRGRLGAAAVHGLAPAGDHRPERAWVETAPRAAPRVARGRRIGLVSPAAGGAAFVALVHSGAARKPRRPPVSSRPSAASARRARAHRERLVGRRRHRAGLLRRARSRRRAAVDLQGPRGSRVVSARKVRLMGYAELHAISNFTFLRGASHPEELVERAAELGYAALALTDE